jgi:hypothetical protein
LQHEEQSALKLEGLFDTHDVRVALEPPQQMHLSPHALVLSRLLGIVASIIEKVSHHVLARRSLMTKDLDGVFFTVLSFTRIDLQQRKETVASASHMYR